MPRTHAPPLVPPGETPPGPRRGRPRLSDDELRSRVAAYCDRYGVGATPDGLPPFPSGRRETPQHREWLAVYRALRRRDASSPDAPGPSAGATANEPCPVCRKPLPPAAREVRLGGRSVRLHEPCADLIERLRAAGARAASRAGRLLWGSRPPG